MTKKKIKGKCNHCGKTIFYYFKKGRVNHFCNNYCYGQSLKGNTHKKGSKLSEIAKKKVSKGLKKYFENGGVVWNKGKQLVKIRKDPKRFRKIKKYRLRELKQNAIRSKIKGYDNTLKRREEIKRIRNYYQKITGAGRKLRRWTEKEIKYLENNYKKINFVEMALYLDRSWVSISHKLSRLKLTKYNKWT